MHSATSCISRGLARLENGPHKDRARLDAEALLLHALNKNKAWLLAHGSESVSDEDCASYQELIERRFRGEPIQYITGECEFYGLPFHVTRDVLIPRPETEHLVEKVVEWAPLFSSPRILDVGTGSGAIAIALAHEWESAQITAIDVSTRALELARSNANRVGFAERIRFLDGELLAPVAGEQFDLIVSNPPYVPEADRTTLDVEVRDFEPAIALFAGPDGLDVYRRLIPAAFEALVPRGRIALEVGSGQSDAVRALLAASSFQNIDFVADLRGIPRVACAQRPA